MFVYQYADNEPAFLHSSSPAFMLVRTGQNEKASCSFHMQADPVSRMQSHDAIDDR